MRFSSCSIGFVFFFQAEDGIRDVAVTGVQTCALPISPDEPAKVTHPDPNWMACALQGGILPPVEVYWE